MNLPMRNRVLLAASVLLASLPLAGAELVEKIVARVNDRLITNSEFETRFAVFISSPQAGNNPLEAKRKLLSELIDEKLLEERAKELSVSATDEEVETAVERVTALDAAVFSDPPAEYPPAVLLSSSIHLFHVSDRKPAGYRPFAEVKDDLRARIGDDLYDKHYAEYIQKLRREAFIKIYDPA